jgi:hypothetical protein
MAQLCRYLMVWHQQMGFNTDRCLEEFTALRRTPPAAVFGMRYPYLLNTPHLRYILWCHIISNSGHSSIDAAAGGVRRSAVNSSTHWPINWGGINAARSLQTSQSNSCVQAFPVTIPLSHHFYFFPGYIQNTSSFRKCHVAILMLEILL